MYMESNALDNVNARLYVDKTVACISRNYCLKGNSGYQMQHADGNSSPDRILWYLQKPPEEQAPCARSGVDLNASNMEKYTLWVLQLRDFCTEIIIHASDSECSLVEFYAEKVNNSVFYAIAQAESLRFKLLGGLAVQRAGYGVLSQPVKDYIDSVVRHVLLRRASLVSRSRSLFDWDPKGKQGPTTPLPDLVTI
ncbi:40S ribosomal protein S3-3 [Vitis vinifera]|uniref:40S ribosomal protein S3-3 n=1 Tax=Vitis vinifera TaxID=29760 RepID=A0A438CEW5_VITVI|nr:40S ribosomal protein S3-3 [Vitis vinifera]